MHEPVSGADERARQLIDDLGYDFVDQLTVKENRQVYRVRRRRQDYAIKVFPSGDDRLPYPVAVHRDILPLIEGSYGRLTPPSYVDHGFALGVGHYVVLSWIDGRDFHDRWHYTRADIAGGRGIEPYTIDLVLELLCDLRQLPVDQLANAGLRICDRRTVDRTLDRHRAWIATAGGVCDAHLEQAEGLIRKFVDRAENRRLLVSNTDFRFANFIEISPEKTGLVDWDGARASRYELEHCIAYQWLFMWNNPRWRHALLQRAKSMFALDRDVFRGVLAKRAMVQAHTWRGDEGLRRRQIAYFVNVLDDAYFEEIWR